MFLRRQSVLLLVLLGCQLCLVCGTLNPTKRKRSPTSNSVPKELKANSGPVELSVRERDLVQEEPSSRDIYAEGGTYWKNTAARNFSGTVLGYVTPVSGITITLLEKRTFVNGSSIHYILSAFINSIHLLYKYKFV